MREVTKKSVIPVYGLCLVWLLYTLFLPFYRLWHIGLCLILSLSAYFVLERKFPGRKVMVAVKEKTLPADTGNAELNKLIDEGRAALRKMKSLNIAIEDAGISSKISQLEQLTAKIFDYVEKKPKKLSDIKKFMSYYLPTTIKLLESYDHLNSQGFMGENIQTALKRIGAIMDTIVEAYRRQLDNLFEDEAMDITAEIKVLETMIAKEGLSGDSL